MAFAETFARPTEVDIGAVFERRNEFGVPFELRWARLRFDVFWGAEANLKVVIKVGRADGVCERYLVDTDCFDVAWNKHRRATRDFFLLPNCRRLGPAQWICFSYIVHLHGTSIASEHDYWIADGGRLAPHAPAGHWSVGAVFGRNAYRTHEVDAGLLQRDVDWHNRHSDEIDITPKFTKGTPSHPFHPKRAIHDLISKMICLHDEGTRANTDIKVCVDCIDDTDFVNHLLFAHDRGLSVQCVVDWRKMMLTESRNYERLKRAGIDLLGVFCIQRHPSIEVPTDMHTKFIVFGDEDCIEGSFNIGFDRWWANWESGLQFRSRGICRLLDNIFQSIRGGVIQGYGIDPYSPFNLLYTFGAHSILSGKTYRPHQAVLSEINRAQRSLRLCLFTIGELWGEHHDSVIDGLIRAHHRHVDVRVILNGHIVRQGSPARACSLSDDLRRPVIPAVARLLRAGIPVALAYGRIDHEVPYCPIHSKYCVIDERIIMDGSFNWYNTAVFSHDLLVLAARPDVAVPYLHEFEQILRLFRFPAANQGPYTVGEARREAA